LALAGFKADTALLDPMCGSGTIVVEAAQMALGIMPGSARSFGFEKLRGFDATAWHAMRAVPPNPDVAELQLRASDISGDAVTSTRENLVRAGIPQDAAQLIAPKQIDARFVKPYVPAGMIVTNPPYGERIGVRAAPDDAVFFKELGDALKQRFAGWQCFILSSDLALQKKIRLAPARRTPLFNGAIECRLYRFDLVAGSARRTGVPT
jgi:putative N6-adenine-specific DNA methylase